MINGTQHPKSGTPPNLWKIRLGASTPAAKRKRARDLTSALFPVEEKRSFYEDWVAAKDLNLNHPCRDIDQMIGFLHSQRNLSS